MSMFVKKQLKLKIMKMNKLLLLVSFVILFANTKAQNVEPVIDTVECVSVEQGDASMYFAFNSLILSNDNGEMNNYNFNWATIELEDKNPAWEWLDPGVDDVESGIAEGGKYIIKFYLKKIRSWEGGEDWGEWGPTKLEYCLIDITKL